MLTRAAIPTRRDGAIRNLLRHRLGRPSGVPAVQQAAAVEWAAGWWAGIAVGAVNGVALAVIAGWLR